MVCIAKVADGSVRSEDPEVGTFRSSTRKGLRRWAGTPLRFRRSSKPRWVRWLASSGESFIPKAFPETPRSRHSVDPGSESERGQGMTDLQRFTHELHTGRRAGPSDDVLGGHSPQ